MPPGFNPRGALFYRIKTLRLMPVDAVVELEKRYLLQNYARHPLVLTRGDGPYMWDVAGKRYLDFIAGIGVNALGQNHPRIVKAIQEQAARLIHTSNLFYNEFQGPLAQKHRRSERPQPHLLHQQRHGIGRGRAQDDEGARARYRSRRNTKLCRWKIHSMGARWGRFR